MKINPLIALFVAGLLLQGCVTTTEVVERPLSDEAAALANLNVGVGYLREGRPDLAVEALDRALRLDSRSADAHSALALAHDQLSNPATAEQHYRRATRLEPNNAAVQNSYAVFLCRQNRWEDAEQFFRRAAENPRYPTPEAALTNAGICARGSNDLQKAEQYFREALTKDPNYVDALEAMMELSYQNEDYFLARAFMQRLTGERSATARVLWLCFHIEQELDSQDAAEDCANKLREDFPLSAELAQLRGLERDAGQ